MPVKKITNQKVAEILNEFSLMNEAEGVAFKPQAYALAAKTIAETGEELSAMYKTCGRQCIDDLPGVGESIADKIEELVQTGKLKSFDQLKKKYPFSFAELTSIEGIGPKKVVRLYRALKVKSLKDLEKAARAGKIAPLTGFGKRTEEIILSGIDFIRASGDRKLLDLASDRAEAITGKMKQVPGVTHFDVCGSIRRRKETVGDLDFIATSTKPELALKAFKTLPQVERVLEEGENRVFVRFNFGMDGDLLILDPAVYGAALIHFTGSKEHNIKIRSLALKHGWSLSEYGLKKGQKVIAGKTEEEVYKKLGMQWMAPEMREDKGEVEAALKHQIPKLIEYGSLKGDLQVQTNWTDGEASIEDMAKAAKAVGLSYIAITDHTVSLAMTGGLDEKGLARQAKEIDKLNKKMRGFKILKSAEVNILKDGKLDINDEALKKLDVVCVAVHSHFKMTSKEMTQRIISAMKNPLVNILFHPTGRLINARPAYQVDIAQIIRAAKQYKVVLEASAAPERLDLSDAHIKMAVEAGVKLVIDSDGHQTRHFENLKYGIAQARRGWAKPSDVLNTLNVQDLMKKLKK